MPEDDPIIEVFIRVHKSVWLAAGERAIKEERPVCDLFEKGAKEQLAKPLMIPVGWRPNTG